MAPKAGSAEGDPWPEWPEDKYVRYLRGQRARYAWVMRTYGAMSSAQADEAADQRYPYQPPGTAYRELIFHDDAWHWAMRALKGEQWWLRHPELAHPPDAYRAIH